MRVLLAPDGFGSSLTAAQVAATVRDAWASVAPDDEIVLRPLSDGGPGFLDALRSLPGALVVPVSVPSPIGRPVPAEVLVVDGAVRTAYVETAQAIGLPLVPADRRDPGRTTTVGVGSLLEAALRTGATRVVVGLGGSSTNDAGAGMLAGLGLEPAEVLAGGGGGLGVLGAGDLAGLPGLRERLRDVEILVATDVDVPLLGLTGASAGFAAQKGATPEQAQELERQLDAFARAAVAALGDAVRPDLLGGRATVTRLTQAPGAGAAGGLGFGLSLLGARLVPGAALVADLVGLDEALAGVDLVVTGEGRFDWQSLHGKVASQVATRALAAAVPTVVLAGEVSVGRRELLAAGITAAYAVGDTPEEVRAALADPVGSLRARAIRVARTWSR
ncbi:glycerate kinase family protein [Cellulomonas soli]|uniref:glycerate kinase family protein n=1 Tax=Cellulomonas soli TaxID=931535 RepID=UPI0015CD51EC|nr:glycerate kinase [Cellulomonas soli]NYI60415.1 glycerate kinase [Cellulomonas soli]